MQVQLQSTTKVVELVINGVNVPARIWEGHTAAGVKCHAYITRIACSPGEDEQQFKAELLEQREPTIPSIPLRMIL